MMEYLLCMIRKGCGVLYSRNKTAPSQNGKTEPTLCDDNSVKSIPVPQNYKPLSGLNQMVGEKIPRVLSRLFDGITE